MFKGALHYITLLFLQVPFCACSLIMDVNIISKDVLVNVINTITTINITLLYYYAK